MAKKLKDLNEVCHAILDIAKSKPERKSRSDKYPNEFGLYSLSGFIFLLEDKYTTLKVSQSMTDIALCKEVELSHIMVKNHYYDIITPYYYSPEVLSEEEAKEIADKYEQWSKKQAIPYIIARKEARKKSASQTKKRKVSQKQLDALARARAAKKAKKDLD
ncbi:MAG: hypothetical protein GF317_24550 [Candidatus Lokiarchaeota archaeon]|nr:hypothetical protein [Candidatus Lokiarchaeota archaeon]